jgi:hypothetical protein
MKGTVPIITCDSEYGCTEWSIDYYEMTASNWRSLMSDWKYDPHNQDADMYCPEHVQEANK